MKTFAEALAKSTDSPICPRCVKREQPVAYARPMINVCERSCALCGETALCSTLRDWRWPQAKWRLPLETKAQ